MCIRDRVYTLPFRIVVASLAAIGVILTPIYLLSMLREIFFGKENAKLISKAKLVDAEPREIYIIACLLVPIIGIGLYPKIMTDTYISSIDGLVRRDLLAVERIRSDQASIISSPNLLIGNIEAPLLD